MKLARVKKGTIPKADNVPDPLPSVGGSQYEGDPSPYDIDQAIAAKADDEDFAAAAKFLKENFGVQSPEKLLLVIEALEFVTPEQLASEAEQAAQQEAQQP